MKRKSILPYFLVFATMLLLISFSKRYEEKARGSVVAFLAPFWQWLSSVSHNNPSIAQNEEMQRLSLENQLLKEEMQRLKELAKHQNIMQKLLPVQVKVISARVIFRSPASWNSSLWIDIGETDNECFKQPIIVKNSPVLVGASVIGIIDYVGLHQSRVRLITDSGLTPSVQAMRIDVQNNKWLLAKGELHGNGYPLWRCQGNALHGIGFNTDFPDKEGPARDLRTGKPLDPAAKVPTMPILKEHDLLVTTGMDGVFPPGLHVAEVTSIQLLKEGDYFYELEARPTAGDLNDLSLVFVIAPLGYDPQDPL